MKTSIIILIAGILLATSIFAQSQLYADININVKDNGQVSINGNTNYNQFNGITTNNLTSKSGDLWLLNISSPVFEEYIYRVMLPKNAIINYLKANGQVRIEGQSGSIAVIGTGREKPIDLKIQYSIGSSQSMTSSYIIYGILIITVFGVVYYFVIRKKKSSKPKKGINRELYTERQLIILDYLQKHGTVTQAQLEKDLKLPKSSLSRNIDTLVQKEVIFKESKGMSNVIGFR